MIVYKRKILIYLLMMLVLVSCRPDGTTAAKSQTVTETKTNSSIHNTAVSPTENDRQTFAKTFVVTGKFDESKKTTVYTDHLIEFKDNDSGGISVYVYKIEKASLKIETNRPEVRTDFLESSGERLFVLFVGSSGFGSCGDSIFAVAQVNEKLEVKLSKTNEPNCQGEFYPVKIESADKKDDLSRRIFIGDLRFDVKSFDWQKSVKNH